jgi:hypothetical protein
MTKYKYIPIDYFTYNRPDYYAALITLVMFGVFYVIMYLVFKYESYNQQGICDPMFYYGEACRNKQSRQMLFNPKFLTMKQAYYNRVSEYNTKTGKNEGVRERTAEGKEKVNEADNNIQDNLDSNTQFGKENVDELTKLSSITQLIASKYLGNIGSLLKDAPQEVLDTIQGLPEQIGELKNQIQGSIINPAFTSYTAPLQKLYRSLTDIDKKTSTSVSPGLSPGVSPGVSPG